MTVLCNAFLFIAQATQPATGPATQGTRPPAIMEFLGGPMAPLFLGVIVLYIFMYRSKRKQDQQLKDRLGAIKRGDEVMTAGGMYGKIVEVRDGKVLVKVDETSNTKIWFSREAIRTVITEEKPEAAK